MADRSRSYRAVVVRDGRRVLVPVPFDPNEVWETKREYRVHGTVNGMGVRAVVDQVELTAHVTSTLSLLHRPGTPPPSYS